MMMNIGGIGIGGMGVGRAGEGDSAPLTSALTFATVVISAATGSVGSGGVYMFPSPWLVVMCVLLYQMRAVERYVGSRKATALCALSAAAYFGVCTAIATTTTTTITSTNGIHATVHPNNYNNYNNHNTEGWKGEVTWWGGWAYWYLGAVCVYYAADVPSAYTFRVAGSVRAGSNVLVWLGLALCVGMGLPAGAVAAAAGACVGLLCRTRAVGAAVDRLCCSARGRGCDFRDCHVGLAREARAGRGGSIRSTNTTNSNNSGNGNSSSGSSGGGGGGYDDDRRVEESLRRQLRVEADPERVRELVVMGIDEETAREALSACDNNVEAAVNRIFSY